MAQSTYSVRTQGPKGVRYVEHLSRSRAVRLLVEGGLSVVRAERLVKSAEADGEATGSWAGVDAYASAPER